MIVDTESDRLSFDAPSEYGGVESNVSLRRTPEGVTISAEDWDGRVEQELTPEQMNTLCEWWQSVL